MKRKEYVGSCYIGAVGPDAWEYPEARDSIEAIERRPGDTRVSWARGTKGFEARQLHFERWLEETKHPFMLLLDADEIYEPDTLERLRSRKLPYLSGYHLRRRWAPMAPLWFKPAPPNVWPREPWTDVPEAGKLHELGGSGWGCILIHRDVAEAVKPLLKGEPFVLEDDMDVWPYDLARISAAMRGLRTLTTETKALSLETLRRSVDEYTSVLEEEIRPLRVIKDHIGSDLRFPFFARAAGYRLMGDPDVQCAHIVNYPLEPSDYESGMMADGKPTKALLDLKTKIFKDLRAHRARFRAAREALNK